MRTHSQARSAARRDPAPAAAVVDGRVRLAIQTRREGERPPAARTARGHHYWQFAFEPGRPAAGGPSSGPAIQRKPPDIDKSDHLNYDQTGTLTNVAGTRAKLKAAAILNAQLRDGWVTPNEQLTGGHLFKRGFGGPDNPTNVVPWRQSVEDNFTLFEDDYKQKADQDAAKNKLSNLPFTATVRSKATFVDRPDLAVGDEQLNSAGWGPTEAGRQERKNQYADVADKFSHIPTKVEVSVIGLTAGLKSFTADKSTIAPDYVLNPAAIRPDYVVPARFVRNATKPREFVKVDWAKATQNDPARKQIQHATSRHGPEFGLTKSGAKANLEAMEKKLDEILTDTGNEQIEGLYRKEEVLHYFNETSRLWLCTREGGELVAAFHLNQDQYDLLTTKGLVR
jgi:hypothetical protein